MKRGFVVVIGLSIFLLLQIFLAKSLIIDDIFLNISYENKNYTIEYGGEKLIKVSYNGTDSRKQFLEQSNPPYNPQNTIGFPELKIIITKINYNFINTTALFGFYINFSTEDSIKEIFINGEKHVFELVLATDESYNGGLRKDRAFLIINGESKTYIKDSLEPLKPPYNLSSKVGKFSIEFIDAYDNMLSENASFLILYEKNFAEISCDNECNISNDKTCENNGFKICGDYDEDVCFEWSNITNCNSDKTCQDGICVDKGISCEDECSLRGKMKCINDQHYKTCGNYDSDSCLEWSKATLCPMGPIGRHCNIKTNNCVTEGSPYPPEPIPPEPVTECKSIGLRESGKFCNPEYKWEIQRLDNAACENDFECKTNRCDDGLCRKALSPNNKRIVWIIIAGLGLIILLVIVIMIKLHR